MQYPAVMSTCPGCVPTTVLSFVKARHGFYGVLSGGKVGEKSSSLPDGKLTWIVVPPDLPRVMVHLPPSSLARSCIASSPTPMW